MTKSELRDKLIRDKDEMYGVSIWCKCGVSLLNTTIEHALKNLDKTYRTNLSKCWTCHTEHPSIRAKTYSETQYKTGKVWDQKWLDNKTPKKTSDLVVAAPKKWYE